MAQGYIKSNPLSLALGIANIGYEHVTRSKQSIQLKGYAHFSGEVAGARLMYKFFLTEKPSPGGLYIAPIVGVNILSGEVAYARAGGIIGYQRLFSNDRFTFEGGIGPAVTTNEESADIGVLPILVLNFGFRIGKGRNSRN